MATTLQLNCDLRIHGTFSNAADFGDPAKAIMHSLRHAFPDGTGDNQCSKFWADSRTVTAASETLDVVGGLTDAFGNTISFTAIKLLMIRNKSTIHSNVLTVSGTGLTNFSSSTTSHAIKGGGVMLVTAPVSGFGVSGGTADQITINPASATIDYDIIIGGV